MYTMVMNLLNFTAGVLTVDRETEEDQAALESYPTPCVELQWIKEVRNSEDQTRTGCADREHPLTPWYSMTPLGVSAGERLR